MQATAHDIKTEPTNQCQTENVAYIAAEQLLWIIGVFETEQLQDRKNNATRELKSQANRRKQ